MPKTIKKIEHLLQSGQKWADIGGGKFNNVKQHFESLGVDLFIYDPFNRTKEHNEYIVNNIANSQCDGVMINNVLNVILEKENRKQVINQAFDCLKPGGIAYFKIYEGNCSGITKTATNNSASAQLNQPTYFYLEEIQEIFGQNFKISKEFIVVSKPIELNHIDTLILESKKYNIPQRNKKTNVGKFIDV